ncbi:MAG: DUF4148 domain-containing protein [Aquabacterium sp.]|nr:MAG: DUF4148 domain-containing protein [Aquabacterium sp.]
MGLTWACPSTSTRRRHMNSNIKSTHRYALAVVGALSLATTQVWAAGSEPVNEPVATTADRFVHVRGDREPVSTLTRAEVLDEVRQIRESGQLLNSDPQRSRFRPDTAAVIESPAPVVILAPAPQVEQTQPPVTAPQGEAPASPEDITPQD